MPYRWFLCGHSKKKKKKNRGMLKRIISFKILKILIKSKTKKLLNFFVRDFVKNKLYVSLKNLIYNKFKNHINIIINITEFH